MVARRKSEGWLGSGDCRLYVSSASQRERTSIESGKEGTTQQAKFEKDRRATEASKCKARDERKALRETVEGGPGGLYIRAP